VARVQLFLSTVSAEFLCYRECLRQRLTRPNVEMKVQEDFIVTGNETLEMLDEYIKGCDGVIHLVGDMTGSLAKAPSLTAIKQCYPDLATRLPLAEFLQPDGPSLPYTQWEAWLALLHKKKLFIATPTPEAARDAGYLQDPAQQALQQAHLKRLRAVCRYPGVACTGQEHLAAEVLRSFDLDLLTNARSYEESQFSSLSGSSRKISIFLASSSELKEDRDAFDLYFRQENDRLSKQGIYLEIQRWENFLDAMSEKCMQDDYNSAIRMSDIFVCLINTKAGGYTEQEFDAAYKAFSDSGKPLIYTFFKIMDVSTDKSNRDNLISLWAFQDKLSGLGHFHTHYKSCEDLQLRFRRQLDKLLDEGKLIKGVNPALEKEKFRERVVQQTDQSSKGEHTSRTVNPSLANQQLFFSESDLVREIEITQEMQERGAINKDNAIILQSQRIAQIRILRSSKP
jgi:hypothetical protein